MEDPTLKVIHLDGADEKEDVSDSEKYVWSFDAKNKEFLRTKITDSAE